MIFDKFFSKKPVLPLYHRTGSLPSILPKTKPLWIEIFQGLSGHFGKAQTIAFNKDLVPSIWMRFPQLNRLSRHIMNKVLRRDRNGLFDLTRSQC